MNCAFFLILIMLLAFSISMSQSNWFEEKTATAGLVAGFFGGKQKEKNENFVREYSLGLALGWLFSSSVFVNNSVKVVTNALDFEKDQREEERNVRLNCRYINTKNVNF